MDVIIEYKDRKTVVYESIETVFKGSVQLILRDDCGEKTKIALSLIDVFFVSS